MISCDGNCFHVYYFFSETYNSHENDPKCDTRTNVPLFYHPGQSVGDSGDKHPRHNWNHEIGLS